MFKVDKQNQRQNLSVVEQLLKILSFYFAGVLLLIKAQAGVHALPRVKRFIADNKQLLSPL